jgi:CRP/FNR family transcriptional regulator, cyclic AMP receptor protein
MSLVAQLRDVRLLREFDDQELAFFDRLFANREYRNGEILIKEGDRPEPDDDALFVLMEGRVRVSSPPAGAGGAGMNVTMGKGEVLGLINLVDSGPRAATCRALGPVRAAVMSRRDLQDLILKNPAQAERFLHLVARQLGRDLRRALAYLREVTDER